MYSRKYYKKEISIDKPFNSRSYWKIVALQIIVSIFTITKNIEGPLFSHMIVSYILVSDVQILYTLYGPE